MSAYHLQARRMTVTGSGLRHDETHLSESESLDALVTEAHALTADGFTVWIFRRTARAPHSSAMYRLELVTKFQPSTRTTRAGQSTDNIRTVPDPPGLPPHRR